MKFPLTNNPDVDNFIYKYVYYTEELLLKKYREIHKKNFADTLKKIRLIKIQILLDNIIFYNRPLGFIYFTPFPSMHLNVFVADQEPIHDNTHNISPIPRTNDRLLEEEDCNIKKDSYKSKSKYKNIKYFNHRKKYKNPKKNHKLVGGKCVRFKYVR